MNYNSSFILPIILFILLACGSKSNDPKFLEQFTGKYLYTEDELANVHSEDGELLIDWRGAKNIKPLKTGDDTFYVKEMNAKIQFLINPTDNKEYLVFIPKEKDSALVYKHVKVADDFKTPSQYLSENNYKKALEGYLNIKNKDSLNPIVGERLLNRTGYRHLRDNDFEKAINVFKINIELYPESSNVYDSYAEALLKKGDTTASIINYQKSIKLDSGNRRAKERLKRLQKKDN